MKLYRKQLIEYEQFTQENEFELIEKYSMELFEYVSIGSGPNIPVDHAGDGCMVYSIDTKRGQIHLVVGDWIATGVNGEHWAISDDVFKEHLENSDWNAYQGGLLFNVYKYIDRAPYKGKRLEDLNKARWYLDKLIGSVEND